MYKIIFFILFMSTAKSNIKFNVSDISLGRINRTKILKNKLYNRHILEAKYFNTPQLKNFRDLPYFIDKKILVFVPTFSRGYVIDKLTHSKPFLLPRAKYILDVISDSFFDITSCKLIITSLLRSQESHNKLRSINHNASKGESPHTYGVAFDISYMKFINYNNKKIFNNKYMFILENILYNLQLTNDILYIKEYKQKCFHITVINKKYF